MGKDTTTGGGDDLTDLSLLDDGGDADGDNLDDGGDADVGDGKHDAPLGDGNDKGAKNQDDDAGFVIEFEKDDDALAEGGDLDDDGDGQQAADGKEEYGKKVRARILREQRIARDARARAEAERVARIQAENRSIVVQKEALELSEMAIESQIKSTTSELRKAKEDGKTDDEITHQTMLSQLYARKEGLANAKRQLATDEERVKQSSVAQGPTPLASEWKSRNPWFGHARYGEQTAIASAIDRQLASEGYDKNTSDYYMELTKRLRRRCPELQRFTGGQQQQQQRRRDPAGAVVRRDQPRQDNGGRKGVIRLTAVDRENMRAFGIDLNDPKAVKEYALNKMGVANG